MGFLVAAAGGLVLAGWWLDLDALTNLHIRSSSMKANTAVGLALAGLCLVRHSSVTGTRGSWWAAQIGAALVTAIGAATLLEWMLAVDLGIDTLLAADREATGLAGAPGRMAPTAALVLVLLGSALLLVGSGKRRATPLAHLVALAAGIIGLVALIGYVYGVGPTFGLARFTTQMAIHTASASVLLSVGLQLSRPDHFLAALATGDRAAGVLVRRLLPASLLFPTGVGWVLLTGQRLGHYGTELGLALCAVANVITFASLVAWIARAVEVQDQGRRASDRKLKESHDQLESRVQERTAELRGVNERLQREVAERERAQEAERASTQWIKTTIESANYSVITTALDGTIVGFNPTAERLLGWRADEVIGRSTPAIIHDEAEVAARAAALSRELGVPVEPGFDTLVAGARHGLAGEVEWSYVRKDGSRFPVLLSVSILRDGAGQPCGYVGIASDQTERHRADAQVRELRHALESAVEGIARLDTQGRYVAVNAAYAASLGCAGQDLVGTSRQETIPTDHVEAMKETYARMVETGKVETDTVGVRRDGSTFDEGLVMVAIRDEGGELTGHYCFSKDISQQKQAERDLLAAKLAAEMAMRARSDFLARMSHEIRTPMNGVLGMTELALGTELLPEQREFIETAHASANALLLLIDDILDFAKIDAGHLRLVSSAFRLRSCLGSAIKSLSHRAQTKGLGLQIDVPPDVPEWLTGDPQRLGQILINLVSNAIKFTERGHIRLSVERVGELRGAPVLRFAVTDTGVGVARDQQALIFEDFTQADDGVAGLHGGTGLGLAIVRQLVQLMEGDIGLDSEPGRGSTFWFAVRLEVAAGDESADDPLSALRGRSVLIVDDDEDRRRMLGDLLQAWGMQPVAIRPGDRSRALEEGHAFALVDAEVLERHGDACTSSTGDEVPLIVIGSVPPALALLQRRGAIVPLLWPITASALHDAVALALDAARSQVGSARPASPSGSTRGLRVLLAEDNPVNQRVAIAVLERAGHHVVLVEDGRAAVAAARQGDIDIVLMDVQLPVMDGLTAVRLIREAERAGGGHVPIIALTAQAMRDERERGMAAGVDAYVAKPFQARALLAEMEAAVARARGRWQRTDGEVSVAPGAGRTGAPVFDRLMALDRMGGDAVLLGELIGIFMAGVSSRRGAIQTALASGDGQLLGSVAHALRGSLLTLAALPAAAAAWELEEAASVPGTPTAAMATALEVELERLVAELGPAG